MIKPHKSLIINKRKAVVFSLGLAALTLTATNLNAQYYGDRGVLGRGMAPDDEAGYSSRGLMNVREDWFGYNLFNQQFGSDVIGGYELYNQTFGQDAPLGTGLLILTAAGAGYALTKRKSNKKH